MEDQLLPFVDTILKEKALAGMTPEAFAQLRRDMVGDLKIQIDRAIINELSEEQTDEFSTLLDKPETTDETLQQFIQDTGIDTTTVIARTMVKFKEFYLGAQK